MSRDPFAPSGPIPPEMLQRYLRGELNATERHQVELELERDPLLREAAEGLALPGALEAAANLRAPKVGGGAVGWTWAGMAVLAAGILWWTFVPEGDEAVVQEATPEVVGPSVQPMSPPRMDSMWQVVRLEIEEAAPPIPSAQAEAFERTAVKHVPMVRDTVTTSLPMIPAPTVVDGREPTVDRPRSGSGAPRSSRRLVFLHDLKLVHPDELYRGQDPKRFQLGLPADASGAAMDPLLEQGTPKDMAYLRYMDEALEAFSRERYSIALEDLLFLLNQYPNDVNVQFYAGLTCFRAGLYLRARTLLARAENNPVDVFQEEAEWYLARTVEQIDGAAQARSRYERIAQRGGFYAEQAAERSR